MALEQPARVFTVIVPHVDVVPKGQRTDSATAMDLERERRGESNGVECNIILETFSTAILSCFSLMENFISNNLELCLSLS